MDLQKSFNSGSRNESSVVKLREVAMILKRYIMVVSTIPTTRMVFYSGIIFYCVKILYNCIKNLEKQIQGIHSKIEETKMR